MADTVTSQTLVDGKRNCVMKFTNISDGTGEAAVVKVDVSALSGAPTAVKIEKIQFATFGMGVDVLWDATTPGLAIHLPADITEEFEFREAGGLVNPKATGWTGDIKFTTLGAGSGDRYTVVMHMAKKY